MTVDITTENTARMLDEAAGLLAAYQDHPDVADQTIRLLGSSETMTLHEMLSDLFAFIAWAREAVPAMAARIAGVEAELHLMKTAGVIEVAVRNPSVFDYMKHWESRAELAEARVAELEAMIAAYQDGTIPDITAVYLAGVRDKRVTVQEAAKVLLDDSDAIAVMVANLSSGLAWHNLSMDDAVKTALRTIVQGAGQ